MEKGQKIVLNRLMYGHTLEMAKMFYVFSHSGSFDERLKEFSFDAKTQPIIDTLSIGAKRAFDVNYDNDITYKQKVVEDKNNVIVCFSGGKDSTAAALEMRSRGYNVYLYYVQGINKSYPDEMERATKIASYLKMPLTVESVTLKGKTDFHDNPVKNQLIASMALDFGVENNIGTTVCFGDFYTDVANNSSFLEAWSDCQEMWQTHKEYVRNYVPNYDIIIPFKNYIQTMDAIAKDITLLNLVQGCILPHRFREVTKKKNEEKFGVKLLPNRCGSCWKCCVEYIHHADIGVMEYDETFYKHCLDFLKEKMDVLHNEVVGRDYATVYKTFLYGDFKDTKYYKDVILCGK